MDQVKNNEETKRFELVEDGHTAYADYRVEENVFFIDYVFAPPELRGTGAAGKLMQGMMEQIKPKGYKVEPVCGYAAKWLQRSKEYSELVID